MFLLTALIARLLDWSPLAETQLLPQSPGIAESAGHRGLSDPKRKGLFKVIGSHYSVALQMKQPHI